jgi:hypothetical protein
MQSHQVNQTMESLNEVIKAMQSLYEHPRMQQRNWVAAAKYWLPILRQASEHLQEWNEPCIHAIEAHRAMWNSLGRLGLKVHRNQANVWTYSWDGVVDGAGNYSSPSEAMEAALRGRLGAGTVSS